MLTTDRCRQLVAEFRSIIEQVQGVTFPALEPPATEVELAAAEERVGLPIPNDLKALYQMTSFAGPLTAFNLEPLLRLDEDGASVRIVLEELEGEGLLTDDPDERSERSYLGDKPQGNFMSFGRTPTERHVVIEVDGPLEGRILGIDVFAGGDYEWVCLARSLESFLQLEVELARTGAYEFVVIPPRPDAPDGFLSADPAIRQRDVAQDQFDVFCETVTNLAAQFGGAPGTVLLNMSRPSSSG